MYMYIFIYLCIYIYTHTYIHMYIYTHTHIHTYICIHTYIHTYVYTYYRSATGWEESNAAISSRGTGLSIP